MFDSLKDLYISYPFMPVENPPEFFKHVKDLRCVVTLPAADPISQVENDKCIWAQLKSIDSNEAVIQLYCNQAGGAPSWRVARIPVFMTGHNTPSMQSYVLVDEDISISGGKYELQPDTLLFIQEAPVIKLDTTTLTDTVTTAPGHNVSITKGRDGIIVYGAPGVGLGVYTEAPDFYTVPAQLRGKGATSINGLSGDVWIKAAHPVSVDDSDLAQINTSGTGVIQIKNAEVQG